MPYVQDALGDSYWERMRTYHRQVIGRGLAAPEPAPGFVTEVVRRAEEGLRARGYGEERLLSPVWQRLQRRANPAQRMRGVFQSEGLRTAGAARRFAAATHDRPKRLAARATGFPVCVHLFNIASFLRLGKLAAVPMHGPLPARWHVDTTSARR